MKLSDIDASRFLLILIVALLIAAVFAAMYTFQSNPVEDAIAADRVINVLFVLEHEKEPLSTYVLMYYPNTGRAAVFDIPGELGLLISRINRIDRIDRVYDPAKIGNFQNEIERLFGIDINFSLVITTEKLVSLVDLLEGVEIFIPSVVSHRDGDSLFLFPSGMTILDGDKAGLYALYTLPGEDRETIVSRRQRFFMGLLDRWIRKHDSLKNPASVKLYYSLFKTNMSQRTMMRLFGEFSNIDAVRTNIQAVTGIQREVSGQTLIIPHFDGALVKDVVRQTVEALTRQIEGADTYRVLTVEVLNGTAITGFAGRTADTLRSFGYDIISVGNAERNTFERTTIIHRSGSEEMVTSFAEVIRCRNIQREFDPYSDIDNDAVFHTADLKADVTLIIGRDFNGRFVIGN